MYLPEEITHHYTPPGCRKFLKRKANRRMRRLARRNPEEAPRRHLYRGYS